MFFVPYSRKAAQHLKHGRVDGSLADLGAGPRAAKLFYAACRASGMSIFDENSYKNGSNGLRFASPSRPGDAGYGKGAVGA